MNPKKVFRRPNKARKASEKKVRKAQDAYIRRVSKARRPERHVRYRDAKARKAQRRVRRVIQQTRLYVTSTGNFEHLRYSDCETNFLKSENIFQKSGVLFFS